jgi:hypothetical protein
MSIAVNHHPQNQSLKIYAGLFKRQSDNRHGMRQQGVSYPQLKK